MKKKFVFFACLAVLGLCKMPSAQAQTYEVGVCKLTTEQTVPADYPADDAAGWVAFKFKEFSGDRSLDTVWKAYLRTAEEPVYINSGAQEVTLNEIGFDFNYGGRTMTHFGVTGNGSVFLADAAAAGKRSINPSNATQLYAMSHTDEIMAMPRMTSYKSLPYTVVDKDSRIRYYVKTNEYLIVNFKNLIVRYFNRVYVQGTGFIAKEYAYRWSSDVILYADGRVQTRISRADLIEKPSDDDKVSQMLWFAFGLFGQANETAAGAMFTAAPKGENGQSEIVVSSQKLSSSIPMNPMEVKTDSTDITNMVFTYVAPQPCVAPAGVTAEAEYPSLYTDAMSVTLKRNGVSDGWVAFLADKETSVRPADGTLYAIASGSATADEIDGYPVRVNGNRMSFEATDLVEGQQYYLYIYPYNNECLGGPKYGEAIKITAPVAAPSPSVTVEAVTATSVRFAFPDMEAGKQLLVGVSRRAYRTTDTKKTHYELDSAISGKTYQVGQEMFRDETSAYGTRIITVAHVGAVENNSLTMDNLLPGTPYYFYFWQITGDKQYSAEYTEANIRTVGTMPYTISFVNDRVPRGSETDVLPAGWSGTPVSDLSLDSYVVGNYSAPAAERSALQFYGNAEAVTPVFRATQAATEIYYRIKYGQKWSSVAQFGARDTLKVAYAEEGKDVWTTIDVLTQSKEDTLVYGADRFATRKISLSDMPVGKNLRLKFSLKQDGNYLYLHNVLIEPTLPCAYAENIVVESGLSTSRTLTLSWEHSNVTASALLSYRLPDEDQWSEPRAAYGIEGTVRGLKPNTAYELAVRLVCGPRDSSLVKTVKGTTLRGLPYAEVLRDLPTREESSAPLPDGISNGLGELPADGSPANITGADAFAATSFKVGGYGERKGHNIVGLTFAGATKGHAWLRLPVIALEETPYPARCMFRYKSYTATGTDAEGQPITVPVSEKVGEDNQFRVLVLVSTDGRFRLSDSVAVLTIKDFNTLDYKTLEIDLSNYTNRVYIALYADDPTGACGETETSQLFGNTIFGVDSISIHYTDNLPCDPVEYVRLSNITQTTATLSWTGYSDEYAIEFTNDDTEETKVIYTKDQSYTFTDLTPGTLYLYRIQGYCEADHRSPSAWTEEDGFMTRSECTMPTDFAVVSTTDRSVQITAKASGLRLIHVWGQDYDAETMWVSGDTTNVFGLSPETTYKVAVRNVCMATDSSAWKPAISFTTQATASEKPVCGAPTDLSCDTAGSTYAVLNWVAGENNVSYLLAYRPSASAAPFTMTAVTGTSYRIESLRADMAYAWRMNGVCAGDTSALADGPDFTTAAEDPGTAVEPSVRFAQVKVISDHGRIAIYNAAALPIDRVEVYNLSGRRIYGADFGGATDHLLLPVLDKQSVLVLVRIFSAGETAVYKTVLM